MAFVLTLQLLVLLFATTGFAASSPECPSSSLAQNLPTFEHFALSDVLLGIGYLEYKCTDSGSYDVTHMESDLFNASCVSDGNALGQIVNGTKAYFDKKSGTDSSDVGPYIESTFHLDPVGNLTSHGSTSVTFGFGVGMDSNGDSYEFIFVEENGGYSDGRGTLANEDNGLLLDLYYWTKETDGPSPSTCTPGFVGSVDVIVLADMYMSLDNDNC